MTTPQGLHQKVKVLQLQLDDLTNQLGIIRGAIAALVDDSNPDMSRAATQVLDAIGYLADVCQSQGQAAIAEVKRLLESSG